MVVGRTVQLLPIFLGTEFETGNENRSGRENFWDWVAVCLSECYYIQYKMSSKRRSRHDRRSRSSSSGSSRSRSHSQSSEEAEGVRLHVADLEGMGVSKHELQYVFDKYGPLKEIWVAKSPPCFAFVVFRDREDAEDALRATDGM
uniref:RRM domain-containing protein n=1 Tax=Timema shepardi TaxID=629360 RepID=A0A7R9FXS9_TIMSH|nr:unnamed protein product [Timema shepardi]